MQLNVKNKHFIDYFNKKTIFERIQEFQYFTIKTNQMTPNKIPIYFPMQKLAKILPNKSSLVISPVISPKWYKA